MIRNAFFRYGAALLGIVAFTLFALPSEAQPNDFQYSKPIPAKLEPGSLERVNAKRLQFFLHPRVPGAISNFKEAPSVIAINGEEISVQDIVGVPGFPPPAVLQGERIDKMLSDPMGLCFEDILANLICPRNDLTDFNLHQNSWVQMVADLRKKDPGERNVEGAFLEDVILEGYVSRDPYGLFNLGSVIAGDSRDAGLTSPPAVCYDVTAAEDWMACPVFGTIFLDARWRISDNWDDSTHGLIEVHSPILLYRVQPEDALYHLVGYLANPHRLDYYFRQAGGEGDPGDLVVNEADPDAVPNPPVMRVGNAEFPMAIESGNFFNHENALGRADIAVMSTATLSHIACNQFIQAMQMAGMEEAFPHRLNCSEGYIWARSKEGWDKPRNTFDTTARLIAPPKVFDLATGNDNGKDVLFAPSNAVAADGKFYVYKYFEGGFSSLRNGLEPILPQFVPPRVIEVAPPQEGFAPYRVATAQINTGVDALADFALTWKQEREFMLGQDVWESDFSRFVSVFISRQAGDHIEYKQFDFQVPKINAAQPDLETEISSVAFGMRENKQFMVVGNQNRIPDGEGFVDAYVYIFPITGGIIENEHVVPIRISFEKQSEGPGVFDLSVSNPSGTIAGLMTEPFIRAPEGCTGTQVYSPHWFGRVFTNDGEYTLLDSDNDGTPNRCECREARVGGGVDIIMPDENNDPDFDELANVGGCDSCPSRFNIGDKDGDDVDEACDNCPATACIGKGEPAVNCRNHNQADSDEDGTGDICDNCPLQANDDQADGDSDGVGDACDICPALANPAQARIYFYTYHLGGVRGYSADDFCGVCRDGYIDADGNRQFALSRNQEENGCLFGIYWHEGFDEGIVQGFVDADNDAVPDAKDNCVYVSNPPGREFFDFEGVFRDDVVGTGQPDADGDGSGDACDCPNAGPHDDCDGDGVPNRFDHNPQNADLAELPPPDTVYDPYAPYIARASELRAAQAVHTVIGGGRLGADDARRIGDISEQIRRGFGGFNNGNVGAADGLGWNGNVGGMVILNAFLPLPDIGNLIRQAEPVPGSDRPPDYSDYRCGSPAKIFPGPFPCDSMNNSNAEMTAVLPWRAQEPPPPPPPPPPGECIPSETHPCEEGKVQAAGVSQFCIARVGRVHKKTAAIIDILADRIIAANDRVQEITGVKDFDLFVGGDGGLIHWECVFNGGAAPNIANAAGVLPNVAGNVAAYSVSQVGGIPVYQNYFDSSVSVEERNVLLQAPSIAAPNAVRIAPIAEPPAAGVVVGLAAPPVPNLGRVMAGVQEDEIPAEGVQFGNLRQNVNGNMLIKVLNANSDFQSEGVAFSVGPLQSLIAMDMKSPPEPFDERPVEDRALEYDKEKVFAALEAAVASGKQGLDIFRDLPWNDKMHIRMLAAQEKVPAAVNAMGANVAAVAPAVGAQVAFQAVAGPDEINTAFLPALVDPPRFEVKGGCGCILGGSKTDPLHALGLFGFFMIPLVLILISRRRLAVQKNRNPLFPK